MNFEQLSRQWESLEREFLDCDAEDISHVETGMANFARKHVPKLLFLAQRLERIALLHDEVDSSLKTTKYFLNRFKIASDESNGAIGD